MDFKCLNQKSPSRLRRAFLGGCSIHIMGGDLTKLLVKLYNKEYTMSIVKTIFEESL